MRFDGQHIAKLGDRIDLETLGVADNHGVKPFALPQSGWSLNGASRFQSRRLGSQHKSAVRTRLSSDPPSRHGLGQSAGTPIAMRQRRSERAAIFKGSVLQSLGVDAVGGDHEAQGVGPDVLQALAGFRFKGVANSGHIDCGSRCGCRGRGAGCG